ncbi:MAG: hypothetical protein AAGA48_40115 [Myxococcota bacterium]
MATTRDQLEATLSVHDADALMLILMASEVDVRDARTSGELAKRLTDAVWWSYCTPVGYLADQQSLEDIVTHVADRFGLQGHLHARDTVYEQLRTLTRELAPMAETHGISVSDLSEHTRRRLGFDWRPTIGFGGGAAGSFGTRWTANRILDLFKGPIGRLLPLLPIVGPWMNSIRWGASAVSTVAGPLGIALSVASLNASLGPNYRKLLPLLLGIGALGPDPVEDAEVVLS